MCLPLTLYPLMPSFFLCGVQYPPMHQIHKIMYFGSLHYLYEFNEFIIEFCSSASLVT